jgi:uncharacterized protein (DUF58 family)
VIAARLAPSPVAADAKPAHRGAYGLTPRSLGLLAVGLIFIAPAWLDRRALLLLAIWDLIVITLIVVNARRLTPPAGIHVVRTWSSSLTLGSPSEVRIDVHNRGNVALIVRVADYVSGQLRRDLPEIEIAVAPHGSAQATYTISPSSRGDMTMGDVALRWRDAWALIDRWGIASLAQTVRVYPSLEEGRRQALYLIRSRQITIEKRRARRFGGGRDFESLRDYRQGDEQRDVSWTVSAKRGKLVTKVYQPERSQTVWLLVDAGRLLRARTGSRTILDETVGAALTLAQVALASGDRVGLLAYGRRVQHRIAPSRGAGHLRVLVEALATVHADGVEADHAGAAAAMLGAQKRRALIVWLTEVAETAGVPEVIENALRMAPSHVVLFGVVRQPEVSALAASVPASPAAMYRVMAAQETIERREALLHGLKQRGALVVEMSPAALSEGLVDRYLEVKERGLL